MTLPGRWALPISPQGLDFPFREGAHLLPPKQLLLQYLGLGVQGQGRGWCAVTITVRLSLLFLSVLLSLLLFIVTISIIILPSVVPGVGCCANPGLAIRECRSFLQS